MPISGRTTITRQTKLKTIFAVWKNKSDVAILNFNIIVDFPDFPDFPDFREHTTIVLEMLSPQLTQPQGDRFLLKSTININDFFI